MQNIVNAIVAGFGGYVLASAGVSFNDWQFWVMMVVMTYFQFSDRIFR